MNDVGEAIHKRLQAVAAVTAICSTRGYPDALPQGVTLPAYTYRTVSDDSEHHLGGPAGLSQARVQVDCYAATRKAANQLCVAVRNATNGETGTWGDVYVRTCHKENQMTGYEPPIDGSDGGRYFASLDLLTIYVETNS